MDEYHIGREIEKEVRRQYASIDAFAKALHRERQTVYDIFKRAHIATDRLMEVSKLLKRDFFKEFSDVYNYGATTEEEDETEVIECISQLIPEDELQIITTNRLPELIDEFFLSERKKPLIVIHGVDDNVVNNLRKVADDILGKGMVKCFTIRPDDIFALETSINRIAEMPQKAYEINYTGTGCDGGFDDIIILAEQLATVSNKFVVVSCTCINTIGKDADNKLTYCSLAEECFDTWHKRTHIFVADNANDDFARRREIFKASHNEGYIDKALSAFDKGDNESANKILNQVLLRLNTYRFERLENASGICRFYAQSVFPTPEERALLDECNISIRLTAWFDMIKDSGKFIAGGEDTGDNTRNLELNRDSIYGLIAKGEFN